jgi:hypothetical protein
MNHMSHNIKLFIGRFDHRHFQLILLIITLSLFVLGAGAPGGASGGPGTGGT